MNYKYSVLKFVLASVTCCLLLAAILSGCGGSNNPSGPAGGSSTTPGATAAIAASGTVTLNGLLIDSSTSSLISESKASITVTASLIGTNYVATQVAKENSAFSFFDIPAGNYFIKAIDTNSLFESTQIFKDLSVSANITMQMVPVTSVVPSTSYNFFGTVAESSLKKPVMFGTILVKNSSGASFETSTLFDGSFSLVGLSIGTYELTFTKTGFVSATRTLTITADRILIGAKDLTAADISKFKDGADVERSGYNIGEIVLAPVWVGTGAITGILLNPVVFDVKGNKVPYANTRFDLLYDDNPKDAIPPGTIISNFLTNSLGYFFAKNLPQGFYKVATPGYTTTPIFSGTQLIGYNITYPVGVTGTIPLDVWLEVKPGSVTPIPEEN